MHDNRSHTLHNTELAWEHRKVLLSACHKYIFILPTLNSVRLPHLQQECLSIECTQPTYHRYFFSLNPSYEFDTLSNLKLDLEMNLTFEASFKLAQEKFSMTKYASFTDFTLILTLVLKLDLDTEKIICLS